MQFDDGDSCLTTNTNHGSNDQRFQIGSVQDSVLFCFLSRAYLENFDVVFPHAMPLTAFTDHRGRKTRKLANLCTAMSQFISPEASLLTVKACWKKYRLLWI